jgi:histidyl-tRNA synthetase
VKGRFSLNAARRRGHVSRVERDGPVAPRFLEAVTAQFGDRDDVAAELGRLSEYQAALAAMGLGDFVEIDLKIVRGLAYYTGIVFELFDRKGELRAICGGGRYDRLLELVGGEPLPAVGFGMGDVVLTELLRERETQ